MDGTQYMTLSAHYAISESVYGDEIYSEAEPVKTFQIEL